MSIVFETDRMVARRFELADVDDVFAMYSDPEFVRYIGGVTHADRDESRELVERAMGYESTLPPGHGVWALETRVDGVFAGAAILKAIPSAPGLATTDIEVGWHLRRGVWGQGYATEAARALLDVAFDRCGLPHVVAVMTVGNEASRRVAEKAGMRYLGLTTDYYRGVAIHLYRAESSVRRVGASE